jgi:hypothetical protein
MVIAAGLKQMSSGCQLLRGEKENIKKYWFQLLIIFIIEIECISLRIVKRQNNLEVLTLLIKICIDRVRTLNKSAQKS